ncbi:MAG: dienelactone hydrolase family protein [Bradyrhizobium sp.]
MSVIQPPQLLKLAVSVLTLYINFSVPCSAGHQPTPQAKSIQFEGDLPFTPNPLVLKGYLRRPEGAGRYPAIVLLHGCVGFAERLDQHWGERLASWGYVTLAIDSFGPRGIENVCGKRLPRDQEFDPFRALNFLVGQPFVDPRRIIAMGFSQGGSLALLTVERGANEQMYQNKFRAAVAFYPYCEELKGIATVPALILIGERDVFTSGCRDMAEGRSRPFGMSRSSGEGFPIKLIVYPGAHQSFDFPRATPIDYLGYHLEFSQSATDQSIEAVREFLHVTVGGGQ